MTDIIASVVGQKAASTITTAINDRNAYDMLRGGQGTSTSGGSDQSQSAIPQSAPMPDYSQVGTSNAAPQQQAAPQTTQMTPLPTDPNAQMLQQPQSSPSYSSIYGNSYASDFNPNIAAASIKPSMKKQPSLQDILMGLPHLADGGPVAAGQPVVVGENQPEAFVPTGNNPTGDPTISAQDGWQPQGESLLGKIGDAFLMLRGQQPIFRQRTAQANQRAVMQQYYSQAQNDMNDPTALHNDQLLAQSRLEKIGGADPALAGNMGEQIQRGNYFDSVGQMRQDQAATTGRQAIGGIANMIEQAPEDQRDQLWQKNLPLMQGIANRAGLGDDYINPTYDPQVSQGLIGSGYSTNEQVHNALQGANIQSEITARQQALQQRTIGLELKRYGLQLQAANYKDLADYRDFSKQAMVAKSPAAALAARTLASLPANPAEGTIIRGQKNPDNMVIFHGGKWLMIKPIPGTGHVKLLGELPGQGAMYNPNISSVPDLTGAAGNGGGDNSNDDNSEDDGTSP